MKKFMYKNDFNFCIFTFLKCHNNAPQTLCLKKTEKRLARVAFIKKIHAYEDKLKAQLPSYAWRSEEGESYVASEYMIDIERRVKDYELALLREMVFK